MKIHMECCTPGTGDSVDRRCRSLTSETQFSSVMTERCCVPQLPTELFQCLHLQTRLYLWYMHDSSVEIHRAEPLMPEPLRYVCTHTKYLVHTDLGDNSHLTSVFVIIMYLFIY